MTLATLVDDPHTGCGCDRRLSRRPRRRRALARRVSASARSRAAAHALREGGPDRARALQHRGAARGGHPRRRQHAAAAAAAAPVPEAVLPDAGCDAPVRLQRRAHPPRRFGPGYFVAIPTAGNPRGARAARWSSITSRSPDGRGRRRLAARRRQQPLGACSASQSTKRRATSCAKVSAHVSIGAAFKRERPLDHYFVALVAARVEFRAALVRPYLAHVQEPRVRPRPRRHRLRGWHAAEPPLQAGRRHL